MRSLALCVTWTERGRRGRERKSYHDEGNPPVWAEPVAHGCGKGLQENKREIEEGDGQVEIIGFGTNVISEA